MWEDNGQRRFSQFDLEGSEDMFCISRWSVCALVAATFLIGCDSGPSTGQFGTTTDARWKDRWQANPFSGTKSLEVTHVGGGPGEHRYVIDEPEVVASLVRELKITRIENDLAVGLEPSAWDRQQWKAELAKLEERDAGSLALTPGVSFDLPLVIAGERRMLIPRYGRVTFQSCPINRTRNAIENDPETATTVELLPR